MCNFVCSKISYYTFLRANIKGAYQTAQMRSLMCSYDIGPCFHGEKKNLKSVFALRRKDIYLFFLKMFATHATFFNKKQSKGFFILMTYGFLFFYVLSIYGLLIILIVSNVNLIICDEEKKWPFGMGTVALK